MRPSHAAHGLQGAALATDARLLGAEDRRSSRSCQDSFPRLFRYRAWPAQLFFDAVAQSVRCCRFAMRDEGHARRPLETTEPSEDLVRIRVGGKHGQVFDL